MPFFRYITILAILLLSVLFVYCATPTAPTGGEVSRIPPSIIKTVPETGTVNFDDDEIRFYFDKYLDRRSFENAFSINPDLQLDYRVRFRGRSVRIQFNEPLPDSTTVIFTLGTELSDVDRNRIRSPIVLALSTGPTIDEGNIEGRILDAFTGKALEGATVLLYREPFDLEQRAEYVAQTDSSGKVSFSYLRDGEYKAFWLNDRNRNRIWDREREAARPFNKQFVSVTDGETAQLGTMFVGEPDTLRPELQGVGMFSSQRLRLRFSREMLLHDDSEIVVVDTLGNTFASALPLYAQPDQMNVVFAHTERRLPEDQTFRIETKGITDKHGNLPTDYSPGFTGSMVSDTTHVRKIRHLTSGGVFETEPHVFQFSTLIEGTVLMDSLQIVQDEIIYTAWEPYEIEGNLLFIYPPENWQDGSNYTARFFDVRNGVFRDVPMKILRSSRMGSIDLEIAEKYRKEEIYHHITVYDKDGFEVFSGKTTDSIEIPMLPAGHYTIRSFKDLNGDGRWFRGSVDPFEIPEPLVIQRSLRVAERMASDIELSYSEPERSEVIEEFIEEIPDSELNETEEVQQEEQN